MEEEDDDEGSNDEDEGGTCDNDEEEDGSSEEDEDEEEEEELMAGRTGERSRVCTGADPEGIEGWMCIARNRFFPSSLRLWGKEVHALLATVSCVEE